MVDTSEASGISVATVAKQIASRGMMQRTENIKVEGCRIQAKSWARSSPDYPSTDM
jgi:hypothetical protein